MSRLLSGALLLVIVGIMACGGATPAPDPTATPPPTSAPAPTATPPSTATPAPTATLTPRATATPVPTAAAPSQVSVGEGIAPLSLNNPQALLSELSQAELTCMAESGDLAGALFVLQAHGQASPEDRQNLFLCLRDGTLLRLFLAELIGQTEPLSGESSACIRDGFAGLDIRSIITGPSTEGGQGNIMGDSMAAFLLAMSCLNEREWAAVAPGVGMGADDRETLQCIMHELGGPQESAAALQPADGGPPLAFFAAAVGCGMSAQETTSFMAPSTPAAPVNTGAPAAAGIAALNPNDPEAFMSELSPAEQSCISASGVDSQQLASILSAPGVAPEDAQSVMQCFADETLIRLFLTQITSQTGTLSQQSSACIRSGFAGLDLRSAMLAGATGEESAAADTIGMAGMLTALSCLNEQEYPVGSAAFGMNPAEREKLQCVMDELGGPEGMATALQVGDDNAFVTIFAAAFVCELSLGATPGG